MEKGVITVSLLPLRAEASHKSEMVSQLLFGETYQVVKRESEWMSVVSESDDYPGYIPEECFVEHKGLGVPEVVKANGAKLKSQHESSEIILHPGSILERNSIEVSGQTYNLDKSKAVELNDPVEFCKSLLNTPYLWGGRSPCGIDCSGLMQIAFKIKDIELPRDAHEQAEIGRKIEFSEAREEDMAFFVNETGKVTHVGLILPSSEIIHASVIVRIDELTKEGIRNKETGDISHKLHSIVRVTA